jgi:hypothetical protein
MDASSISGRMYRGSFTGPKHLVSFESCDTALFVLGFT